MRRARRGEGDLHVGAAEGDRLVGADRPAERAALAGVGDGVVEAALDHPDGEGGDGDTPFVEDLEELGEAATRVPSRWSPGTRHSTKVRPCVSEACQPIFRYGGCTSIPVEPAGTTIVEISSGTGQRGDRDERRDRCPGVGDVRLLAVDDPLVGRLVVLGAGAGPAGVAAGVGLGQPEGAEGAAGAEVRQPALLLRRAAELVDRVGAEADACFQGDGDRLVDPCQLLDRDADAGEVAATPADGLGERDAEQAELAHLTHDLDRELVGAIPLRAVRLDLGGGEVAHEGAQRRVVVAQLRVRHRAVTVVEAALTPARCRGLRPSSGPTIPSTPSCWAAWNARTASSVCSPKAPSTAKDVPPTVISLRRSCRHSTWGPVSPRRNVWPIVHVGSMLRSYSTVPGGLDSVAVVSSELSGSVSSLAGSVDFHLLLLLGGGRFRRFLAMSRPTSSPRRRNGRSSSARPSRWSHACGRGDDGLGRRRRRRRHAAGVRRRRHR